MLLAIDTSAGTSVAVVDRDGGVLSERSVADTRRHAEVIGRLIEECLAEADVTRASLSGVAAGMGPGPFTGLRVGIAAARVFALGLGKPLVPVVSHDAIAFSRFSHVDQLSAADARQAPGLLVVTDARRREVYWSAYSGQDEDGLPVRTDGPALSRPAALDEQSFGHAGLLRLDAATVPAGALGMVAELTFAAGHPFPADEPLYLRSPDVTLSAGPKRVSS
ncbi:tRNA (adenosine(37)-N6)-threonylcarbamoyltransferase complex dimerization subunit type 1 TsaB [Glaciibacter superstes]|uniref:tRNA (adenosine(37)-N6)-threonylcarbamoyltransferase complex dimerization subunit type 1 TsaB n=1 Tax=Glaciibacter superstes TaxID=501023 RepID=UPI0003B50F58|nr:tRNA (adenosine(37)-N6)-threonylcarbamoyltransferase complex dimerization subunit type 1 TsaB [Glaciibacter superstes]